MENVKLRAEHIAKSFGEGSSATKVISDISMDIAEKEMVCILGPSGCGKTTTLRIIGGFEKPDAGDVFFASQRINDVPPNKRNINTVFQKYALFPHLNVAENIAFGLNIRKVDKKEVARRVEEMLDKYSAG